MVFLTLLIGSTWGKPGTFLVETKDAAVEPNGYKEPITIKPKDYQWGGGDNELWPWWMRLATQNG